jgi:dATP pyrophosphohydrolase
VTQLRIGVVDVFVLRRVAGHWEVLVLRRAPDTRCTGAWEVIHGRIEEGETPERAAVREVSEETGMSADRLYSVTVHPFYLHHLATVMLAVVFAAVVAPDAEPQLGPEHDRAEWLSPQDAATRFSWPRSRASLSDVLALLGGGDAGAMEDVLRVL